MDKKRFLIKESICYVNKIIISESKWCYRFMEMMSVGHSMVAPCTMQCSKLCVESLCKDSLWSHFHFIQCIFLLSVGMFFFEEICSSTVSVNFFSLITVEDLYIYIFNLCMYQYIIHWKFNLIFKKLNNTWFWDYQKYRSKKKSYFKNIIVKIWLCLIFFFEMSMCGLEKLSSKLNFVNLNFC